MSHTSSGGQGQGRWSRLGGWLLLAVGAGIVAGTVAPLVRVRHDDSLAALRAPADRLRARVERGIEQRTQALQARAAEAARLREVTSGLELHADAHTFEDLLETEDWWAPYRTDMVLSGIVVEGGAPVMLGPEVGDLSRTDLVPRAREDGAASAVVATSDRALLLAAARVAPHAGRPSRAVVVLGAELDGKALAAMADDDDVRTGAPTATLTPTVLRGSEAGSVAVGLSDGARLVASGGAEAARALLPALASRRPDGTIARIVPSSASASASAWASAAWPLHPGVSVLAVLPAPAPPAPFGLPVRLAAPAIAIGSALALGGLALLIARRRRARPAVAADDDADASFGAQPMHSWRMPFEAPAGATAAESPSTAALAPESASGDGPEVMGRYHLLERIGEGGMAEIFVAATHGAEGFVRHFVVKRMHPHLAHNREAINQFIDEARVQSRLVHSNIVPVFDFGMAGGEYFMALEHIQGCDLEHLVRRHRETLGRALSLPVAYYIVHSVLEALAYAHSATDDEGRPMEIVHRDVAPGNVLMSFRGEVKLSDFGIAKAETRVSRTEVGMVKGNASYMSPEQARGDAVDARSDLFSAGVVLYFCLTGLLMYGGDDDGAVKRLLRAAAGPSTPELVQLDKVPPVAAGVLRRALASDAAGRYQTAREFSHDLAGYFTTGRTELAEVMIQLFPEARRPSRGG